MTRRVSWFGLFRWRELMRMLLGSKLFFLTQQISSSLSLEGKGNVTAVGSLCFCICDVALHWASVLNCMEMLHMLAMWTIQPVIVRFVWSFHLTGPYFSVIGRLVATSCASWGIGVDQIVLNGNIWFDGNACKAQKPYAIVKIYSIDVFPTISHCIHLYYNVKSPSHGPSYHCITM